MNLIGVLRVEQDVVRAKLRIVILAQPLCECPVHATCRFVLSVYFSGLLTVPFLLQSIDIIFHSPPCMLKLWIFMCIDGET